jgi:hypothetical protein
LCDRRLDRSGLLLGRLAAYIYIGIG